MRICFSVADSSTHFPQSLPNTNLSPPIGQPRLGGPCGADKSSDVILQTPKQYNCYVSTAHSCKFFRELSGNILNKIDVC